MQAQIDQLKAEIQNNGGAAGSVPGSVTVSSHAVQGGYAVAATPGYGTPGTMAPQIQQQLYQQQTASTATAHPAAALPAAHAHAQLAQTTTPATTVVMAPAQAPIHTQQQPPLSHRTPQQQTVMTPFHLQGGTGNTQPQQFKPEPVKAGNSGSSQNLLSLRPATRGGGFVNQLEDHRIASTRDFAVMQKFEPASMVEVNTTNTNSMSGLGNNAEKNFN